MPTTDCQVLQQSHVSRERVQEERLLTKEHADRHWDGLSEHTKLDAKEEQTGGSEVVEITFAGDNRKLPAIEPIEDNCANDTGIESIAVWTE